MMRFVDHSSPWISYVIVLLSLGKVAFFTLFTLERMQTIIKSCRSLGKVLFVFSLLVLLMSFSFATDFSCLTSVDEHSFKGLNYDPTLPFFAKLFDFFYLSIVTFTSLGFGDIVPASVFAKLLVMMEVFQSFLLIIFGVSNIRKY